MNTSSNGTTVHSALAGAPLLKGSAILCALAALVFAGCQSKKGNVEQKTVAAEPAAAAAEPQAPAEPEAEGKTEDKADDDDDDDDGEDEGGW